MNKYNIILIFSIIILQSCSDPGGEKSYEGFEFTIPNSTNQVYTGEIVIGGLVDNVFRPTDSIFFLRDLEIGNLNLLPHFFDGNRWKPNLDKIRSLPSERCYFKLKLSNGREEMLVFFNSTELFNLKLPNTKNFIDDYGRLFVNISNTDIVGNAAEIKE